MVASAGGPVYCVAATGAPSRGFWHRAQPNVLLRLPATMDFGDRSEGSLGPVRAQPAVRSRSDAEAGR